MERKKMVWLAVGAAATLVFVGVVAAGTGVMRFEDDAAERLSVDVGAGGTHVLRATSASPVHRVEAGYELTNTGADTATVTLTLVGPDGVVLGSRSRGVAPAGHAEIEIDHIFAGGTGPAGTYVATLTVTSGSAHLTEGEVEFDEAEDDDADGPEDDDA